jgi:hypothetical protein
MSIIKNHFEVFLVTSKKLGNDIIESKVGLYSIKASLHICQLNVNCGQDSVSGIVLSRAKNSGRQCHFKIWLDCHKLNIFPCLIMPMSTKCQKKMRKK